MRVAVAVLIACLGLPAVASAHVEGLGGGTPKAIEAGDCYALRSQSTGTYVMRDGAGYRALGTSTEYATPLRLQATGLGRFMVLGNDGRVMDGNGLTLAAGLPGASGDWRLTDQPGGTVSIDSPVTHKTIAVAPDAQLQLVDSTPNTQANTRFAAVPSANCAAAPEVETNVVGPVSTGKTPFGEVHGFLDTHVHLMAFEFLGGKAHCGKPWDPNGVTVALVDCPDHYPDGAGAVLENFLKSGSPVGTHDPIGWPTFKDWPAPHSLTHEQTYYKWIERTYRAGERLMVSLMVDNEALCNVYPLKKNSCNDMDSVRRQIGDMYGLQAYIDAQNGGPGKGWFRIVRDPFEARRIINEGKLAVVIGIEVSRLFGCGEYNDVPQCDSAQIDRQLAEVHDLGVRDLELVNKFDNGLAGVAFDRGALGVLINQANKLETGHYWEAKTCTGKGVDNALVPGLPDGRDALLGTGLESLIPDGTVPVYPKPPHCNVRGLTDLGSHLIKQMMAKHMILDTDHMSVLARSQALDVVEAARYSGVVSSHSWSDVTADPRILHAGGVIGPYAGDSTTFVDKWKKLRALRDPRFYFGVGFGPDMNGFGAQGNPRPNNAANPVTYPFKSYDGKQTIERQVSGSRVYDINRDGVAHYGLYPDWIQDLRLIAGNGIVDDLSRGAEAYLEMWERAEGVLPSDACREPRLNIRGSGIGTIKLGLPYEQLLKTAGQPVVRADRSWRWCVRASTRRVGAVLSKGGVTQLVYSTAQGHRLARVAPGARRRGPRIQRRGRRVYVVRSGRVQAVGLTTLHGASLRSAVKLALG